MGGYRTVRDEDPGFQKRIYNSPDPARDPGWVYILWRWSKKKLQGETYHTICDTPLNDPPKTELLTKNVDWNWNCVQKNVLLIPHILKVVNNFCRTRIDREPVVLVSIVPLLTCNWFNITTSIRYNDIHSNITTCIPINRHLLEREFDSL